MPSAVALTACTMDKFPQKGVSRPGGNSLNFALGCKRSGWDKVSIVGAVGNDPEGQTIRTLFKEKRINTERLHVTEGDTARNKIYLTEEGERYAYPEDWNGGVYEIFRLSEEDCEFVFSHNVAATTIVDPNLPVLLSKKESRNIFLTIDFLDSVDPQKVEKVMDKLNLAFISCEADEIEKYRPLSGKTPIILLLGKEGSVALIENHEIVQEALPVDKVIDTTGCGDAYQAAFCCKWFETGDIHAALLAGAEAGRNTLYRLGGAF
jgi:sugar/nucleoside kinase (ribokinase family)